MLQKGLKKDDGVRGRREKISSKVFPFFPDHKSTFIGNRAIFFHKTILYSGILIRDNFRMKMMIRNDKPPRANRNGVRTIVPKNIAFISRKRG